MMVLAVTLHNIPEGMAVGVMYAGFLAENAQITATSALALSLGIAIQNFPEGAIISMPLRAEGESKRKALLGGVLSGVGEPIGAVMTLSLIHICLGFGFLRLSEGWWFDIEVLTTTGKSIFSG